MKAPGFGDRRKRMLEDIAIVTGGQVITPDFGMTLADANVSMLGHAKTVKVSKDATTIVDGDGDKAAIKDRIDQIKAEMEHTDSDFDREKLHERLAKLSGGVAVLQVLALLPRPSSKRRRAASRTPCRQPARLSKRASLLVAA